MAVRERVNRLRPETEQALVLSSVGAWITCLRLVHGTSVLIGASVPHAFELAVTSVVLRLISLGYPFSCYAHNTQKTCTAIAASQMCAGSG